MLPPFAETWPPRFPDLIAIVFLFWGYLKSKVYLGKPRTIDELKEAIRREILTIPISMLQDVMENFQNRLQECINEEGNHLTDIVFHN